MKCALGLDQYDSQCWPPRSYLSCRNADAGPSRRFQGEDQRGQDQDRIAELERMVGRLTMELEVAKKPERGEHGIGPDRCGMPDIVDGGLPGIWGLWVTLETRADYQGYRVGRQLDRLREVRDAGRVIIPQSVSGFRASRWVPG